jgi:WD40 repeat protein
MIKSPFKFLDSYTIEDRNIFFGRDHEIAELYRRVFESKILLVYGVSGTGKSSLINCGLASRFDDSDWLPLYIRRGSNIIDSLNDAINKQAMTPLKKSQSVTDKLQSVYLDHFKPVYLLFDQFEEIFIFGNQEERSGFIKLIKDISDSNIQSRIIFILREEFLAGMTDFRSELTDIFNNCFRVEKMKSTNAISAVDGPCRVNNIEAEDGFAQELIDKLCPSGIEIELTYLQIYLDRIFRIAEAGKNADEKLKFSKGLLTKAGSVSDLLGQFLEEQIREFDNPDTGTAILKSFVSVQGTRRQMNESGINEAVKAFGKEISESDLIKYLTKFVDLRILRERDETGHFELRHDALAAKIYEKFTAIEKDIIEVRQFIENSCHNWQKRAVLLSSDDLNYIAPYESKLFLSKEQSGLIEKSKNELIRVKRRRRIITIAASITLLVVFAGFTIWALSERNKAFAQSHHSKLLMLIAKAKEANFSNPTKAIRYAQLAWKYDSTNVLSTQTLSDIFNSTDSGMFYTVSMSHREYMNSAVFSPDGKSILTASSDRTAKLWDLSGKCLATLSGHSSSVISATFSPDGKYILTASDRTAKLWDLSGKCVTTFSGHSGEVNSAVFSSDGKSILTGSYDNTAKLWDLSGKCLATMLGHSDFVSSAVFSPDGKYILTGSEDKTAKIWDLSGKCLATLSGHSSEVYSAIFSPDGESILTASMDLTAKLWDLSGKCLTTLLGHSGDVNSAVFSPDGRLILTASNDNTAKLWDLSGKCLATLSGHSDYIYRAVFSSNGKSILTASEDKKAKLWDLSGKCVTTFSGHSLGVLSAVFSPDSKSILTAYEDKTAKIWDLYGKCPVTFSGHSGNINSAIFSPDGKSILTASRDKTAKLWDLSGNCLVTFFGHSGYIRSALFSPDGKSILTASDDHTAKLWDLSGKCLATFSGYSGYVLSAVFSPDGNSILLPVSLDRTTKLWNLSGKSLVTFSGHSSFVWSAVFSPDGKSVLTASWDRTAKLWDLLGKCLVTLSGHLNYVKSAVFSPNGKSILTGSFDKTAKLWDLSGKCLITLSGHSDFVHSAVFSPDGKYILTASDDETAKLWDLSGKCLVTFSGHSSYLYSAVFSSDGKSILTISGDKTAKLWDLSGNCLVTLSSRTGSINSAVFSPDGKYILIAGDNIAKLWLMPSSISEWLRTAKIGLLSPADKAEIDDLDDFRLNQQSDNVSFITDYANWYLSTHDTARALSLYKRALELNPMSIDKKIIGDIYRKQHKKAEYLELYKGNPGAIIKDDLSVLRDTSSAKNYTGKYNFNSEKAKLYEQLLKLDSSLENKINTAWNYNDVGWYGLLSGKYNEALNAILRGIELDPLNETLYTNLPLCYIFTSQYDIAKSIYLEFKNKPWTSDNRAKTFKEVFLSDITTLEKAGITHPDFERIKELLKK